MAVVAEAGTSVLEGMPMGFVQIAADWRITYVNAAAERAFGRRRGDLLGRSAWQAFPGNEESPLGRAYRRVAATRRPEVLESFSTARGTWFEVRLVPAEGGRVNAFFTDSTARHRAQERQAVLARVSTEVADTPDAVQTMSRIPRVLVPVLADWAVVTVLDDDGRPRDVGCWHARAELRPVLARYSELRLGALPVTSPLVRSMHTQETTPVTAAEVHDSLPPGEARDLQRRLATGGGLHLPLLGRGRTLGVITLWWQEGRSPDAEDLAAAREAAERIGLALDNGRLYRQQAALAEELQRSLLTQPVQPAGAEVAVRYTPAAEAARVGGDWYDAFRSPCGAMVLVIGDVVGHDTAAAAAMGQLRGLLRGIATYSDAGPGEVLRGLDAAMHLLAFPTLATAAVARLTEDGAGGAELVWSSAGHLPPLVVGPDGALAEALPWPGDLLLGVDSGARRTEHRVALAAGSTVLMFTDGLVERRDEDLDTGLHRLRGTVAELAERPLAELCDEVVDRLVHGRPDDDVALVAVRLA
ncbi:SpoIIE family protein phosphatase [Klenkia sp. PcliD-1-E]|uniref:SpoIIE family protein phosphatase n=1 Tax=Klenkia sp. PcliD-1-E TaxID=2954492 RepID=UPI0020972355|nr:SpoIIE family protein phosphatase [Klenkia sp. PcliD-1-E]MCO7220617.1 SpoIIE family protein phosphatase [Klenkia sp. PcliD-1-E]